MTDITQADRAAAHTWWMHREHDERDLPAYFARHREAAAVEERAKIVAWLRKTQEVFQRLIDLRKYPLVSKHHMEHCKHSADAIEAGEHLK